MCKSGACGNHKELETLIVGNTVIKYELIPSMRATRLRITIAKDQVKVSVPKGVSFKEAKQFVESKKEWIFIHLEKYKRFESNKPKKEYVAGESFPYLGRPITLRTKIIEGKQVIVEFKANVLWVELPQFLSAEERSKMVKEALVSWYKREAKKVFTEKLDYYAKIMGLSYNQLKIKEQKTRWGSCSGKRNINLNWKAIMAPTFVVDYLIVHELAHLKHMNHSQDFWHLVASFIPEYKQARSWLKEKGMDLIV